MTEKTTDQMILDLVAAGFVLPEGLYEDGWRIFVAAWPGSPYAHDLCACEFARQADKRPQNELDVSPKYQEFREQMADGDTEAAIKALWEACGGTNES